MKKVILALFLIGAGWFGWQVLQPEEVPPPSILELAENQASTDGSRLSGELIPQTDLPPEGTRSLFDHLIKENGSIPYPFEDLVTLVQRYDARERPANQIMVPDGRSLLKGQAWFQAPRLVVAAEGVPPKSEFDYGVFLKGRLHLGFVEEANEIELIAYNEQAGRFEFQLIKNYCEGCAPQLVYARRGICLTCHTSGAPIFSVRPWEETNGQLAISQKILQERNIPEAEYDTATYAGAPIRVKLREAELYDDLTTIGGRIPTIQRMWVDGCGSGDTGLECRRELLRQALRFLISPGDFSTDPSQFPELMRLQAVNWPEDGIAQVNNDLPSRDPFRNYEPPSSLIGLVRTALFGEQQSVRRPSVVLDGEKIEAFDQLPPLPPELDPLTPRPPTAVYGPDTLESVFGVAQMFSPNDKHLLEKHSGYSMERLDAALESTWLAPALEAGPFRRLLVMDGVLKALGVETLPDHCCRTTEELSPPVVQGLPPLEISEGSVLELFETYCFACHRGNPAARLNFMGADSEEAVLAAIQETTEIRDVLDYDRYRGTRKESKLMPPTDSHQRALLDKAIADGSDHVQQMSETIPSLFEF